MAGAVAWLDIQNCESIAQFKIDNVRRTSAHHRDTGLLAGGGS